MDLDRFDWLALRQEEAVDPERPIVDAHHHLWGERQWGGLMSAYLAPQLLEDMTGSHNVVKSVFVDCISHYDSEREPHLQPVGETEFVASQADYTDAAGGAGGPTIAGIVSHADLLRGEAVEEVLAAHDAAGGGRFRGIRHATGWDPSDEIHDSHHGSFEHMMAAPEFRSGAGTLARMGFSFDAWLFHPQLPELAELARAVPELTIILNHLGGPLGIGPYARGRDEARADWRASMRLVAACPNVVLKVGGIGMDVYFATGWAAADVPPGSEEVAAYWDDDVRFCIDTFGPDRCMFESNFPVDRQTLTYPVLWNALQIMAAGYTDTEQDALFSGTATRVYRL
ncbi:MAG: amidohydrolase family protein [Acidimicrobiaceae bacterium]|nr:amidohydrolase family protein [Acidimicrobiaceae bacterium]